MPQNKSLLRTGRNTGRVVTKKMILDDDAKVKNSVNNRARSISKTLKTGVKLNSIGFPKKITTAERKALEKDLAQTQKVLKRKANLSGVGKRLPSGPAPMSKK